MDTDERPDLRRGGGSRLLLKAETEKIIGLAFEVLNEIGHGLNEKIYARADVELSPHHQAAGRLDPEFQKCPAGMGAHHIMTSIRVHPCSSVVRKPEESNHG